MIDTHCHLLPGLDDGPRTLGESIRMGRGLVASGVEHVVCTPHYSDRYPVTVERARSRVRRLQTAFEELGVALGLTAAAEVAPSRALEAPLDDLLARAIAGRFLLVELVERTRLVDALRCLDRLDTAGLTAVIAHPERNVEVQRKPSVVEQLRTNGAIVQVVAPSLSGAAPSAVGHVAWELLGSGNVDLVASDAHRPDSAPLRLDALADVVASRVGATISERVFGEGPRRLLAGLVPDGR